MTRIAFISVGLALVALCGCSVPTRVPGMALQASAPALAGPSGPFVALDWEKVKESSSVRRAGDRPEEKGKADPEGKASKADPEGVNPTSPAKLQEPVKAKGAVLMVPASGDARARLARSARRLVGIRKSFDGRSFIGHLLAICDRLPRGSLSAAWTVDDVMRQAEKSGTLAKATDRPVIGDIVFFKCKKGCGADAHEGTGAGVVIDVGVDGPQFVAYHDGVVQVMKGPPTNQLTGSCPP